MEKVGRRYKLKAFGVAKEIMGGREVFVESAGQTVADLRRDLLDKYPGLQGLRSLMIAVNNVYAEDFITLDANDEIAIIPPVSGG